MAGRRILPTLAALWTAGVAAAFVAAPARLALVGRSAPVPRGGVGCWRMRGALPRRTVGVAAAAGTLAMAAGAAGGAPGAKTIRWGIVGLGDVCAVKAGPAFYKVRARSRCLIDPHLRERGGEGREGGRNACTCRE